MARRWLSLAARHAFDPSNTQSSLKHFGSGELLCRASLMSALRRHEYLTPEGLRLSYSLRTVRRRAMRRWQHLHWEGDVR